MKIFVSWSGNETKAVAEALRQWLPPILMGKVQLFVSSQDIAKGERGLSVIAGELADNDFGIVVLSSGNLKSEWVHFEAGALAKAFGKARVSPVLLDVTQSQVVGPLSQFQMTVLTDKEDVWKLVETINSQLDEQFPSASVRVLFDNGWDAFNASVTAAMALDSTTTAPRTVEDMVEEILVAVRALNRPNDQRRLRDVRDEIRKKDESIARLAAIQEAERVSAMSPSRQGLADALRRAQEAIDVIESRTVLTEDEKYEALMRRVEDNSD